MEQDHSNCDPRAKRRASPLWLRFFAALRITNGLVKATYADENSYFHNNDQVGGDDL